VATVSAPLKFRWSLTHNYLAGITAGDWWRLLRAHGFAIDACYWHRAAFISFASLMNSLHHAREDRHHAAAVDGVAVPAPLFILGHWRSGTTHLHNLLALDTDHFAFPNTYQVVNPRTFLTTEAVNTRLFAWMVPSPTTNGQCAAWVRRPAGGRICTRLDVAAITLSRHQLSPPPGILRPLPDVSRGAGGRGRCLEGGISPIPAQTDI
jgi:hypothetical protein